MDPAKVQLEYFNQNPGNNSQAGIASAMKSAGLFCLTNSSVLNFGAIYASQRQRSVDPHHQQHQLLDQLPRL